MNRSDVREQMLGAVPPRIVGKRHVPTREDVTFSNSQAVSVEFCVGCGWKIDLTLDHANYYMETGGLPEQTPETLAGKFIQRSNCMLCAESGDDPGFQILDIPRSS